MYSGRGDDIYGKQQPYSSQSSYTPQTMGGTSLTGQGSQETEMGGYRGHGHAHGNPSAAVAAPQLSHFGDMYSSVYGSTGKQISQMGMKGSASTGLEGRSNYASSIPDSPKFGVNEYVPSSRGYGQKIDQLYPDRLSEYSSIDRRQYSERNSAYMGRDLPSETAGRHADLVAFGHGRQILNDSKLYDRMEHTTVLRQEQMLKTHALQPGSVEGGVRQSDYLAARATVRQPVQDPIVYGARLDSESRNLLTLSGLSYGGPHATSILGAAPQRRVEDLYAQSSSNPGYGVSLPPGRDYGSGKGLHGQPPESDYSSGIMGHVSHLRIDDRNSDRSAYVRDLERRDKDRDYLLDREKDKEREKDQLRERERERERERTREREKREWERERENERDRREKNKDRDRKRGPGLKRNPTPSKVARDRSSSLSKDIKTLSRESPRREVSHRLHSPVKEKRREYICKVFAHKFVDVERDYLSLDKRYPRLYISPECSKVVVCWPKKNLQLPLYTPMSFEHDVEDDIKERKKSSFKQLGAEISKTGQQTTVWNAKIVLMSGLSQNALAELSSERTYDDRIPHFCNMLRFAVLKKNSSLIAIGGPWDIVDGGDPSVDDSCLIQTALRYAKDVGHLDLKNCMHWNRFLEVHYHRVGKDGLFSHKEVTVLYVPDLSECLPPLDLWRDQWLNHKKIVAEREHQQRLKKEISGDKGQASKEKKKSVHAKDGAEKTELQKKKGPSSAQSGDDSKKESKVEGKGNITSKEEKDKSAEEENDVTMKVQEEKPGSQKKKKIIKRIVKKKIAVKKDTLENSTKNDDEPDKEAAAERKNVIDDANKQSDRPPVTPAAVKTFARKRAVKKAGNFVLKNDECTTPEIVSSMEVENADNNAEVKSEEVSAKVLVKKKVIKRVPKKKTVATDTNNKIVEDGMQAGEKAEHNETVETKKAEVASTEAKNPNLKQQAEVSEDKKEKTVAGTKGSSCYEMAIDIVKPNLKETKSLKEVEVSVEKNSKIEVNKVVKEMKRINEAPPRHPGLIIRTKECKSLSLSLDSLLDYNDTDIEESTFELSLFAESLYEMLQYEMGCRLLSFLEILRIKFVSKRKQGKRQREETSSVKKKEGSKRAKKDKAVEDVKSPQINNKKDDDSIVVMEDVNDATMEALKTMEPEIATNCKVEDDIEEEEDPEEDEEMKEASPQHNLITETHSEEVPNADDEVKGAAEVEAAAAVDVAQNRTAKKISNVESGSKGEAIKPESEKKRASSVIINKELLQAFRFFDRNRAGYLRVEDMRLVIHNLGKYLSNRDVKELVQSALLESSTGRDDRILYDKLVIMSDI